MAQAEGKRVVDGCQGRRYQAFLFITFLHSVMRMNELIRDAFQTHIVIFQGSIDLASSL